MFKNILNTVVILFALGLAGVTQSAPLSKIAQEFNACTSSADQEVTISEDGVSSTCCSKSLGYCIDCSQTSCVKVEYRSVLDSIRPEAPDNLGVYPVTKPPSLRDQTKPRTPVPVSAKAIGDEKPIEQAARQKLKLN